ncbi:MAG: hypothetical protein Fur0037_10730 [Planctomycetota bacterium]
MQLTLEQRLLRFLAREEDDEERTTREIRAQPVELRVLDGECIHDVMFRGRENGAFLFDAEDDQSKFRIGDPVFLGDGHDLDAATPLLYGGFDARTGMLRLERDPYARVDDPPLRPGARYSVDRRPLGLRGRLRDAVRSAFRDPAIRAVLLGEHVAARDEGRHERAREKLLAAGMNEAQVEAGAASVATEGLHLVQGPPGTGKTRLLGRLVAMLCGSGCRIALSAFTHRAVDNALFAIREAAPDLPLFKVGNAAGGRGTDLAAAGVQFADARRARLPREGALVAGTCFQIAKLPDREMFHFAFFDEAGQLPIPHALPGMLRARRWVFFGDHCQLPPVVTAEHEDREAQASVFEHLHRHYGASLLDTTYRMNEGLCRVVSDSFYGGRLKSDPRAARRRLPFRPGGRLDEVLDPENPIVWLRLDHRQPGQRSIEEARAVADVVEDLLRRHGLRAREVSVITPFRAQIRLIRSLLQQKNLEDLDTLSIDTVERIQGQEREAVVISLAVGDPSALGGRSQFFFSTNRLNVAVSRARTKAVCVASPAVFEALPFDAEGLLVAARFREFASRVAVVDLSRLYCG